MITAAGAVVTMAFTTVSPDGSQTNVPGSVTVSAFGGDGLPLSPTDIATALKTAARAWYTQKYGPQAVAPALPAAFQIN